MADYLILIPGFDPTSLGATAPNNSQLLQMVQAAQLAADIGGIIESQTAPDTTLYPILKRFRWAKLNVSNERTGEFYYYDDAAGAYTLERPAAGSITGAAFVDGSISVTKLAPGTATYLLRTNAAGNLVEFVPVDTAIPNGSLSLAKLASGVALPDYVIRTDGGGQFIVQLFPDYLEELYALDKFVPASTIYEDGGGVEGQAFFIDADTPRKGVVAAWLEDKLRANTTPTNKLNWGGAANATKYLRLNADGTDVSPTTLATPVKSAITSLALPTSSGTNGDEVVWPHGLNAIPDVVDVTLVCIDAAGDGGYPQNTIVNIASFSFRIGDDAEVTATVERDATNITVIFPTMSTILIGNRATGASQAIDPTKWSMSITAIKFT